ncbi:unnamed protein product [Ophioblennius macclurei]
MASSNVTSVPYTAGNVVVVTHVMPAAAANGEPQMLTDRSQNFRKGHPKALGTVQVMIGAITLLFGIATAVYQPSLGIYSGIFVWGSLFYITSGSLAIAAEKSLSRCLLKNALAFNIVSAVFAGVAFILYSMDPAIPFYPYYDYTYNYDGSYRYYYGGYSGVLAVFQFLELLVAIVTAAFACKAICNCCTGPQVIIQTVPASSAPQAPPQYQAAPVAPPQPLYPQAAPFLKNPEDLSSAQPPAYDPVL